MNWGVHLFRGNSHRFPRLFCAMLALAGAALPGAVQAKEKVTATGQAQATVVAPLTIIYVQGMSFGRIVPRPTAGTVTVDQNTGQCIVTGAILEVGNCRYAQFSGMGTKNMNARISLTNVVNLTGPGQAMVLDNIVMGTNSTISYAGNPNANGQGVGLTKGGNAQRYTVTTNSGIYILNIGGRLNVNANQAPGVYTGSIAISVQYN